MKKIEFELKTEFIPLIQLLKATNVVESGSEAQVVVVQGLVKRNGVVELRKRAKIVAGENVQFAGYEIVVS